MPSPFPGMDPYLEDPSRWPDVHHGLIGTLCRMLVGQLAPRYIVRAEERVYDSGEEDAGRSVIVPDLRVARRPGERRPFAAGGPATIAEPIELELLDEEVHEARLAVLYREYRQLTAVIEVVSPTNKVWGAAGRDSYVRKRAEVAASPAHFVEIDLLRSGTPLYAKEMFPPHEYLVHVSRATGGPRRRHQFWPIELDQALPVIAIPLRAGDPDAGLDLQAALTAVYAERRYDLDIDYTRDPVPPLTAELAAWARTVVAATPPPQ